MRANPGRKPLVECHHCKGSGKLPLSDDMMLTLDAMRFLGTARVQEVATAVMWTGHITAINNRLEGLRGLGFLGRAREGRTWVYHTTS